MLVINPSNNQIEFQLKLENAEIKETTARLVVEVDNTTTVIPLELADGGWCKGELPLNEQWDNRKGNLTLEVIAKNTFFKPFTREVMFEGLEVLKPTILEVAIDLDEKPTPKRTIDVRKPSKAVKTTPVNENRVAKKPTTLKSNPGSGLTSEIRDFFKIK